MQMELAWKNFMHFLVPTRFFEKYSVEIVVVSIWQGRSGVGYTEKMVLYISTVM